MDELLRQILMAADHGLYYLSLFGSLAVPDVCAGLESPDGLTNRSRYKAWFERWVEPKYRSTFTAEDAYRFRCSMLHQGTTQHPEGRYARILFFPPGSPILGHRNVMNDALNLDIREFARDTVESAVEWRETVKDSPTYQTNLSKFVTVHPNGVPPYIVGTPVIA